MNKFNALSAVTISLFMYSSFVHSETSIDAINNEKFKQSLQIDNTEYDNRLKNPEVLKVDPRSAKRSTYCFDSFPDGQLPLVEFRNLYDTTVMLCNVGYVTTVNSLTKTPLFSAEYINASAILLNSQLPSKNVMLSDYKRETRLPPNYQITIDEYEPLLKSNSLFKMTPLTPPTSQPTEIERNSTYRLSNIAPINRRLANGLLMKIENGIKKYIYEVADEGYVVTGLYYKGSTYRIGNVSGAAVPNYIFKAFYFPKLGKAGAYWIKNDEVSKFKVISLTELQNRIGINLFPSLKGSLKNVASFPPRPYSGGLNYFGDLRSSKDINLDALSIPKAKRTHHKLEFIQK